jgi:zona occludens toxin (predicted ATPase)
MKTVFVLMLIESMLSGCAHAAISNPLISCESDPSLQSKRSTELLEIAKADQDDRSGSFESIDWNKVNSREPSLSSSPKGTVPGFW